MNTKPQQTDISDWLSRGTAVHSCSACGRELAPAGVTTTLAPVMHCDGCQTDYVLDRALKAVLTF